MKRSQVALVLIQVIFDILFTTLAVGLAYRINLARDPSVGAMGQYLAQMVIFVVTVIGAIFFNKLYTRSRGQPRLEELLALYKAVTIGSLLAIAFISFLLKNIIDYRRPMMVLAWLLALALLTLSRVLHIQLQRWLMRRGVGNNDVLLVGTGEVARIVLQKMLNSPQLGYRPVGLVAVDDGPQKVLGLPVLGKMADLPSLIEKQQVQEVIICLPEATHRDLVQIVAQCERERVSIRIYPDVFQIMASEVSISDLAGLPLLTMRDVALRGWHLALKRAVDIAGSTAALVILSPLMMLTALLIKLESPGPVFYVQERMGLDAKPFLMLKFRSMRDDAERQGPGWRAAAQAVHRRAAPVHQRPDGRHEPGGAAAGAAGVCRAVPPEHPALHGSAPREGRHHRLGASQRPARRHVNGLRGDTSIAERTKYDLWYIENWSIWLDMQIIARTALRMFSDRQAY